MASKFATVAEYLASLSTEAAAALDSVRAVIHAAAPGAIESISYQIIAFSLDGRRFVHLAGWRTHVSLYPVPAVSGDLAADLAADLARYRSGASTLKLPLAEPLPLNLIRDVVTLLAFPPTAPDGTGGPA